MKKIAIRVPATSANLGPGFDSLGIALALYNDLELSLRKDGELRLFEGSLQIKNAGALAMVRSAIRSFESKAGTTIGGVDVKLRTRVPIARGLGSSVTIRLGVLMGLNCLRGDPLNRAALLNLVSELEGHPDNAAPAVCGGLVISGMTSSGVVWVRDKLDARLKFVTVVPDFEVETARARALLPKNVGFSDAVHNVNRTALLVAALLKREYGMLSDLFEDRLHQPYRAKLIPQLYPALNEARLAGALGGWLSGSGSTLMALAIDHADQVGAAMKKVFDQSGVGCRVMILKGDHQGAHVL